MPSRSFLKELTTLLNNQRGAIFGMDARIALIIASILIAMGGLALLSRLERSRVEATERGLEIVRSSLLNYYQSNKLTEFPKSLDVLFEENYIDDASLIKDAWDQPWVYKTITTDVKVENIEMPINFAVVYSRGKDMIDDSNSVLTENNYASWSTKNDDVGLRVASRDVELERLKSYRAQGDLITDKLSNYESASYLAAQGTCQGNSPAGWCEDYKGKNYTQLNYYPKSDMEKQTGAKYYTDASGKGRGAYIAGDINDMEQLLLDVGLPASYARDPWNRVIHFHSNVTERKDPPFTAAICFSNAGSCF